MVAKMLLPQVGGAAAVWTTALLFFQSLLLVGYAYSHFIVTRLSLRWQIGSHLLLLALTVLSLPIQIVGSGTPTPGSNPITWVLITLLIRVGLPFFCLTTLSPLLQSWFVRTGHLHSSDPYFLYRASNLGSFTALVAYPIIIERFSGLEFQTRAWQIGYISLLILIILVSLKLWRSSTSTISHTNQVSHEVIPLLRLLRWVALATVPSLWLLAVTTYFTTQIRPIPLLWVIPLAIYLLSFAIVFGKHSISLKILSRIYPYIAVALLGLTILGEVHLPFLLGFFLQFGAFFIGALLCHGQLAKERPGASKLTTFYLALAIGGALGGLIGAIFAPLFFHDLYEFPIAIILTGLLLPRAIPLLKRELLHEIAKAMLVAGFLIVIGVFLVITQALQHLNTTFLTSSGTLADLLRLLLILPIPALAVVAFSRKPIGLAIMLSTILILLQLPLSSQPAPIYQSRDFFGVHKVITNRDQSVRIYENAGTIHGLQLQSTSSRDLPTTYYSPTGPAGEVFQQWVPQHSSIAVIGLGVGTLACYNHPGESWDFYEIDPEVIHIAKDPHLFTFLSDCTPKASTILGDGRIEIASAKPHSYDLIVIDAFSGDAPPIHVLTREALVLYTSKLRQNGVLLFNISNSYVDFRTVLSAEAKSLKMVSYARADSNITPQEQNEGKAPSDWMVLSSSLSNIQSLVSRPNWMPITPPANAPIWTDDYSNLFSVLRLF
jgi:hypothetical protein